MAPTAPPPTACRQSDTPPRLFVELAESAGRRIPEPSHEAMDSVQQAKVFDAVESCPLVAPDDQLLTKWSVPLVNTTAPVAGSNVAAW